MPRNSARKPQNRGGFRVAGPLDEYREKRTADRTPEPFGGEMGAAGDAGASLFVVQKHAARRSHYDLRLELDGVLKCWAVPRGPSLDPEEKRLAVQTEDHPVEYSEFEGVIPAGNYGAGAMILWDRGTWVDLEDARAGLEKGKLLFELRGHKLRGTWTLFRTRATPIKRRAGEAERQWLLMKKPDGAARADGELPEESVLSGLTVEELRDGPQRLRELVAALGQQGVPAGEGDISRHQLMLAQSSDEPFTRPGWVFELKYDGYRLLAGKRKGAVSLRYRNGHDATPLFPEVARVLQALPVESVLIDGEVVVLRPDGRPSFSALQRRALLSRSVDMSRASLQSPATYFAFDLVELEGYDLRALPLLERKRMLRQILPSAGAVRYLEHIEERGEAFYEQIARMQLEGMVAKKADSTYVGQRSSSWLKYRIDRNVDLVVVGFTRPKSSRSGFGALHLAHFDPQGRVLEDEQALLYAGRVGTGFSDRQLDSIGERLERIAVSTPVCRGTLPSGDRHVWVEPEMVCEVRYKEWTPQGMLRHPVFLRERPDKPVEQCVVGDLAGAPTARAEPPPPPPKLSITNRDKVFWPEDGLTKGDLIDYYRDIGRWILPYLRDRPVVLTRYPDGIDGKSFFQKNAPDFAPEWIRTERIWSEGSERDIEYFVCNDLDALLYLANLGSIPLHIWSSRLESISQPDWCILDLDPKEAPFDHVIEIALELRDLCTAIDLPSFVKTSGSTGLHVLLPLGAQCTYEQSRTLGMLLARLVTQRRPEIATVRRNPERREGKVYIDFVQNGHGRLLVSPFCVRPLPGAPVSTPLHWHEVRPGLTIQEHSMRTAPVRMARLDADPMAEVLQLCPDLVRALEELARLA